MQKTAAYLVRYILLVLVLHCKRPKQNKTKKRYEPEIVPSVPYNSYSRQKYWEWDTHWHWTWTWPGDQEQSVPMLGLSSTVKTNFFFLQHCEKVGWVCAAAGLLPFCRYTLIISKSKLLEMNPKGFFGSDVKKKKRKKEKNQTLLLHKR